MRALSVGWGRGWMPRRTDPWYTVDPLTDCWEWQGARSKDGYGVHSIGRTTVGAHRLYFEMLVGPVPEGLTLDHLCMNRACVNPAHLQPVTHAENCRRGRATKLSEDVVAEMKRLYAEGVSQRELARRYGVSQPCVSYAIRGLNWSNHPAPHLGTSRSGCGTRDRYRVKGEISVE